MEPPLNDDSNPSPVRPRNRLANGDERPAPDSGPSVSADGPPTDRLDRRTVLLAAGIGASTIGLFGGSRLRNALVSARQSPSQRGIVIDPPIRDEWRVVNPPGHPELADDFVGMQPGRRLPYPASSIPRHLLAEMPTSQAYGWGRPVCAPLDGTILELVDDEPDAESVTLVGDIARTIVAPPSVEDGDIRPAAGNYVVIESATNVAFLAHLRRDSVTVEEGDRVDSGQLLGEIGNSGASLFPHLHLQVMSEWTTNIDAIARALRPYRFSRYERRAGNSLTGYSWVTERNRTPGRGERFRVDSPSRS